MNIKKIFWHFLAGSSFKPNLLLLIYGQSNEGTDTTPDLEATGQVPYANMPTYLQTAPSNIKFIKIVLGVPTLTTWSVNTSVAWGWLNQVLHVCSSRWTQIIYAKRAIGGTTLLPSGGGTYDRTAFKTIANAGVSSANSQWGVGNYNVVILGGLCESNGLSEANADDFELALTEWWADLRTNVVDAPIVMKKFGKYTDIDFPFGVPNVQDSQVGAVNSTARSYLVSGGSGTGWEIRDTSDDFSHFNTSGAITLGNNMTDSIMSLFGTSRTDAVKPTLLSAVVENAAPSNIVLTYSKTLSSAVVPFWKDFTLTDGRKITSVSVSGSTVTLTVSEPYYVGVTINLTYTKKQYYENTVCDELGNEADALTNQSVTNNVATAQPTYSSRYISNFSAGVDSWSGLSGGGVASVDGIGGLDDVLELSAASDTTPIIFRNSILTGTAGHKYRIRFKFYVSKDILPTSQDYSITIDNATGGVIKSGIYLYIRRNVVSDQWVDFEFTWTEAGTATAVRFNVTDISIGEKMYLRDIVVDRIV